MDVSLERHPGAIPGAGPGPARDVRREREERSAEAEAADLNRRDAVRERHRAADRAAQGQVAQEAADQRRGQRLDILV